MEEADDIKKPKEGAKKPAGNSGATFASKIRNLFFAAKS